MPFAALFPTLYFYKPSFDGAALLVFPCTEEQQTKNIDLKDVDFVIRRVVPFDYQLITSNEGRVIEIPPTHLVDDKQFKKMIAEAEDDREIQRKNNAQVFELERYVDFAHNPDMQIIVSNGVVVALGSKHDNDRVLARLENEDVYFSRMASCR